uniref:FHA domain-containing protein n=1 Tax=Anopheles minimus TaxID=112268 RepID=A0A182VRH7_9DIPT
MFIPEYVYYLVSQSTGHTVGRTGTNLIIAKDDSISRNHALLQPQNNVLHLTDTGSRYGSYVNDNIAKTVPISKDQPTVLKPGDMIRFGRCGSTWQVGRVHFRCLTSMLTMNEALKTILQKIEAELVSSYTAGLTHLIMPSITVTTKLLHCLVGQVPIVKPEFFQTIEKDCIGEGKPIPSVKDFLPICTEERFVNKQHLFHPHSTRSNLFQGKEFIFLNNAQYSQFANIVQLAGGVCLSAHREKVAKSRLLKANVIIIKLNPSDSSQSQSQSFGSLSQYLDARGRRMVPDIEIGLALMFCSTEKYCNPEYNFPFSAEDCKKFEEDGEILAKNTELQTENTNAKATKEPKIDTIPETEPHTEEKQGARLANNQPMASSSKTNNISTRSTSSFLIPKVVSPPGNVPAERRKSKRMQETVRGEERTSVQEADNRPKRPRRNDTPVESVDYSPVVDSNLTETERGGSELHIPETQPTTDSDLSQALQARGFRAVNRDSMEPNGQTGKEPAKAKRAADVHRQLDENDLFVFDEIVPRKKPRVAKSNENGISHTARNTRNAPTEEENLFCFEGASTTQQRRTANQHKANKTVPLGASKNNLTNSSPIVSSDAASSRTGGVQNRSTSNGSTLDSYREFIKPVQPSATGWLSSTMRGLKIAENGEESSFSEMQIKSEPLDEVDDPYGMLEETKKWSKSVANAIHVREKSMKLVAHRPIDVSGHELSCVASDGGKNFKAFVKKRNYPAQQVVLSTKSVCVRDENQCA